ncbi:MAG: PEGA domain-containing protein [Myxococcales bacterium]|nr:PEGA domain-containing protein [Myxococcales bacterium]
MKRLGYALVGISIWLLGVALAMGQIPTDRGEIKRLKLQAESAFQRKRYRVAITRLARLRQLEPTQADYLLSIARCHDLLGEDEAAILFYRHYLARIPRSPLREKIEAQLRAITTRLRTKARHYRIVSVPRGAAILVDGRLRGVAPLEIWLANGVRRIELRLAKYRGETRILRVASGPKLRLSIALAPLPTFGRLRVIGDVDGARVYLDGRLIGTTPLVDKAIRTGSHRLRVTARGRRPYELRIAIETDKELELRPHLEPLPPITHGPTPRPTSRRRPFTVAAWTTLGSGAALLATGIALFFVARDKIATFNDRAKTPQSEWTESFVASTNALRQSGFRYHKTSLALMAIGGAALATSIVLFIVRPRAVERISSRTSLSIMPSRRGIAAVGSLRF